MSKDNIKQNGAVIKEVSDSGFEKDVIYASMDFPVIACFISNINIACRPFVELLEKAVSGANKKMTFVKINTDKSPLLVEALRIQTVPTVYAFYQGRPIDGFAGFKSEQEIKFFVDNIQSMFAEPVEQDEVKSKIDPATREKFVSDAADFVSQSNYGAAMELYSVLVHDDEGDMESLAGLGWCLFFEQDYESVEELFSNLSDTQKETPRIKGLQLIMNLHGENKGVDISLLEKKAEKGKLDDLYVFGRACFAKGDFDKGMDALISVIKKEKNWEKGKAKDLLIEFFDALGASHPAVLKGKRKLSAVLFS